jgi:hypothetical protein
VIEYTSYTGEDYSPITIDCQGWKNPVVPTIQEGYKIRVYDQHSELINEMTNLSIDGSSLIAETLSLDSISHSVTNKANGEINNLSVSFESKTPINSMGFCYVKYTFPQEYNLTKFDTDDIVASGMFIDGNGKPVTSVSEHNFEDESDPEKWVIIFGCNFDPEEKTTEQLANFK